uniref:Uncharacterized protein n=1 Tax=Panagrolaimus sp. PS1159 TaxID=55785 RepID=A0AC35GIF5_9BILA
MASFKIALLSLMFLLMTAKFMEAASLSAALPAGVDNSKNAADKIPPKISVSDDSNKIFAVKDSPSNAGIISDSEIAMAKSKCGGGCISSSQCSSYDGGNTDCRCSWFSCKLYNKNTGKEIK